MNRRTRTTLANGLQLRYSYNNGSELTAIQIHNGTAEVGLINYAYDEKRGQVLQ